MNRITVVSGPEAVLVDREVEAVTEALAERFPELEIARFDCAGRVSHDDGALASLAERIHQALSPSLFGEAPIVLVRALESADEAVQKALVDSFAQSDGSPIVMTHSGVAKGRGVLNAVTKAGGAVVKCKRPNAREVRNLMRLEARRHGGSMTPQAEQWLVDSIGSDALGVLLSAVRQSVADSGGQPVTEEHVHAIFPLQAKVSAFKVVDHLWAGRVGAAAGLLRGMEQREKGADVAVLAAIAHGLRMMALHGRPGASTGAIRGAGPKAAPWQVDRARENARLWKASGARIAAVAARLPDLDADMKGGLDGGIALEDEQKMAVLESLVVRLATVPSGPA